jgi:flagellin-like hook-associated protein FlgL
MSQTQVRLATGRKVNSALDNPTNFFTAANLNARASDLGSLLDSMSNAIKTLDAADNGIKAITKLVETAQSTARQALQGSGSNGAPSLTGTNGGLATGTTLASLGFATSDLITIAFDSDGSTATTTDKTTLTFTVGTTSSTINDLISSISTTFTTSAQGLVTGAVENGKLVIRAGNSGSTGVGKLTVGMTTATSAITNLGFGTSNNSATGAGANLKALEDQYNSLRNEIDKLARDAGYNGINLLGGSTESLKVTFNETGTSFLTIVGTDVSATGLGLQQVDANDWLSPTEINDRLSEVSNALSSLRSRASGFGSNLSVVQTRQEFTKGLITTLKTGADSLVLADTNEEGANMLALQTRQQLSSTALSLAAQADQAVLRLFG